MRKLLIWTLALYAASTLISMAVMSAMAGVFFLALLVAEWGRFAHVREEFRKNFRPDLRFYARITGFLAFACVLSIVVAKFAPLGYGGRFVQVHFLKDLAKLWYFPWPFVLWLALREAGPERRRVFQAWLFAFTLLSVIGIFQRWTGWPRPQPVPGTEHFHATLFLGHHLSVASIFIFPFFAALELFWKAATEKRPVLGFAAPVWAVVALLGLTTLVFTESRMLWVALPIGIALWLVLRMPKQYAVTAIVALLVGIGLATQIPSVQYRLRYSAGYVTRENLWRANFEFFEARPLTGAGWLKNQELSGFYLLAQNPGEKDVFSGHAHNDFLDALGSTGLLGALAFLLWSGGVIWLAWKARNRGLLCAWVVFQLNGLTQLNFWEGKVMHQMMLAVAMTLLALTENES